jgi:2-polyprenyl-6-methoxyphenol hydroxylase-like FAD-dependent oxidoreductase
MARTAQEQPQLHVAVVGAGIGGLTAAIALTRKGVRVEVLERARALTTVGASLALDPNAMRVLRRIELIDRLRTVGVRVDAIEHVRWDSGAMLLRTPLGAEGEDHFGAPALDFLRSDLQRVLVEALPPGALTLGAEVVAVEQDRDGADVVLENGRRVRADVVVAADGINSRIRQQLVGGDDAPVFSGTVVYRGLVPRSDAVGIEPESVHRYWVGPHRHSVVYWISAGELMAVNTAVRHPHEAHLAATDRADPEEVLSYLDGWDTHLLERLRRCRTIRRNSVFIRRPLGQWSFGRVALLGDAAHAMEPFEAQGAAQAIEDSYVLAECLGDAGGDDAATALRRYENLRIGRATEVQQSSSDAAEMFYLPNGPAQRERDAEFATLHRRRPWGRRQWIWEHDVGAALG